MRPHERKKYLKILMNSESLSFDLDFENSKRDFLSLDKEWREGSDNGYMKFSRNNIEKSIRFTSKQLDIVDAFLNYNKVSKKNYWVDPIRNKFGNKIENVFDNTEMYAGTYLFLGLMEHHLLNISINRETRVKYPDKLILKNKDLGN